MYSTRTYIHIHVYIIYIFIIYVYSTHTHCNCTTRTVTHFNIVFIITADTVHTFKCILHECMYDVCHRISYARGRHTFHVYRFICIQN